MRSKWKNFISRNYRSPAYYFSRSYFFKVEDIGKRIRLHIGRKFREFPIKKSMVGHFAGEFIYCKKLGSSIHIVKKKKLWIIFLKMMSIAYNTI